MSQTRRFPALAVVLLLAMLLTSCTAKPTKGDLTVYVAVPLSGWQADGGQTVVGGARLAAEQLNKSGGLLGYRVNVVPIDDEADSDVAAQVAQTVAQAVESGAKVLGVIGHYNSGQSAVALQTYKDLPIIVITPTASDPSLTHSGYSNFFRVNATDAAQGPYDANYLVNVLGAKRVAVIYAQNDYGAALKEQVVAALDNLGAPAVAVVGIEEAAPTYKQIMPSLLEATPDAVFLAGYETEGYVVVPELREAGYAGTIMCSDGCLPYDFIDVSGPAAEGVYVSAIAADSKAVADQAWTQAYRKLETRNPGTHSAVGYSALMVMAEGVKKAKSLDATAIEAALHQLDFTTLIGPVRYDTYGDLVEQRVFMFRVQAGDFTPVKEAGQ
jgi:branched-chain amino acid transport system substrate-binding protein